VKTAVQGPFDEAIERVEESTQGTYQVIRDDGERFDAEIPPFLLALPNSLNYARPPGSAPDRPSISAVSRGMARSRLRR
jgi:hypothetical protein